MDDEIRFSITAKTKYSLRRPKLPLQGITVFQLQSWKKHDNMGKLDYSTRKYHYGEFVDDPHSIPVILTFSVNF